MINILFRVLTISLLNTLVYSRFTFFRPKDEENHFCFNQNEISVCFPKQDSSSLCRKGAALPAEQYLRCILSSTMCDTPGKFPIPHVPGAYYTCKLNQNTGTFEKYAESCGKGKFFDQLTLMCLNPEELSISKSISDEQNARSPVCDEIGPFPDPSDCKGFYFCPGPGFAPLKLFCGPNMYYNETLRTCTSRLSRSCISKLLEWEDFVRNRARKNYAAVQATLKLGLFGQKPTLSETPESHRLDRETFFTENVTEPDYADFYNEQYNPQLIRNDRFTKLKQKFREGRRILFEKPIRLLQKVFRTLKRLLTLPWRLRRIHLQNVCRKFNEYPPNFNQENLENLEQHEEMTNHNAGIQKIQRIFPFVNPFFKRFPHLQKKTSESHPLEDELKREHENPEETEIGNIFNGKGQRKPMNIFLDHFPAEQSEADHDSPDYEPKREHEHPEETEIGNLLKGEGLGKPMNTLLNLLPAEQSEAEHNSPDYELNREHEHPEETQIGNLLKGEGLGKPMNTLLNLFPAEQSEAEHSSLNYDLKREHEHPEETEIGNLLKGEGLGKPMNTLLNRFPAEQSEAEHSSLDYELKREHEHPEETQIGNLLKGEGLGKPMNTLLNLFPAEQSESEHNSPNYELNREHEHPEETQIGNLFKGKGLGKPVNTLLNLFPAEQSEAEHSSLDYELNREHEHPEETEFGVHFNGKGPGKPISALKQLFNAQKEVEKDEEEQEEEEEDEDEEAEHDQPDDHLTEEEENAENSELRRPDNGKDIKKIINSYNRFSEDIRKREHDPLQEDLWEEPQQPVIYHGEDSIIPQKEKTEEIESSDSSKGKGDRKPSNRFEKGKRKRHHRQNDLTKEQENPEETKFGKHLKRKGHKKQGTALSDRVLREQRKRKHNPKQDDLTEGQENPEKTEFGMHFKNKGVRKRLKSLLNRIPGVQRIREHHGLQQQENLIENKLRRRIHLKKKGHKKPVKVFHRFLGEEEEEEEEEGEKNQLEDDLTKEQENHEETTFGKHLKRKGHKKPIKTHNRFLDDEEEETEHDQLEEEDSPKETKFGKHFKRKGHKKPIKTHNHFLDEEEAEDDQLEEEEEEDDTPKETKFGKHLKRTGHKKPIKTVDEDEDEEEDEEEEEEEAGEDEEDDQPEDDLTEEENPEETEGHGRTTSDPARETHSESSPEEDNLGTEEEEDDDDEEEENTEEDEFENPLRGKGLGRPNKINHFSDEHRSKLGWNSHQEQESSEESEFAD